MSAAAQPSGTVQGSDREGSEDCAFAVVGRVVTETGQAVTRFRLNGEWVQHARGAFEVCSDEEPARLIFVADGFASTMRSERVGRSATTVLGEVVLRTGRRISGRIKDVRTNAPVAGALVDVSEKTVEERYHARLDEAWGAVRSNADGSFVLSHVEEEGATLIIAHDRFLQKWVPLSARHARLEIALDPGATIRGRVQRSTARALRVRVVRSDGALSKEVGVQRGGYQANGLPAGEYIVTLWDRSEPRSTHPQLGPIRIQVPDHGTVFLDLAESTSATSSHE